MSQFAVQSTSQKQKSSEQHLLEAKRNIYSSTQLGVETLESLRTQSEKLDGVEQKLEDTDHLIAQSVRALRGMTWSGTFYNAFSDAASVFSAPATRNDQLARENKTYPPTAPSSSSSKASLPRTIDEPLFAPSMLQQQSIAPQSKIDQDLEEISHALEHLRAVGVTLSDQLGQQNDQLDRVESAVNRVNDKTLSVTLRTSKLTDRTSRDPGKLIGSYQFVAMDHNMLLLGVDGECVVLTNSADTSTVFDVYLRYDTMVGLCSKRTGKYMGATMWGGISVGGLYFGSMEEWYFDFDAEHSGLLCLSKNWGAGGWLMAPRADQLHEDDKGVVKHSLDSTTTSVRDRRQCLAFKAIFCGPPPTK